MGFYNMIYPKCLEEVINFYKSLPGVGEKSAERYALASLNLDDSLINKMADNLSHIKNLNRCSICGHISDNEVCNICSNDDRNHELICVVEDYKSVFNFEKAGNFNGVYHVLNGLISPIVGITPDDINIKQLSIRLNKLKKPEIVIALKSTIEGETTTLYLKKIFENTNVKVSRLSYGIPIGADIDYLDYLTLDRALSDRKELS